MEGICRARLLSDLSGQTACDQLTTSVDGRLCAFHSRQCQALYRGYKKRNEELDNLEPPSYLADTKVSLVVQEFKDIEEESTFQRIHDYLFRKHNLLDRVIRARKLHHSHFFAIDHDYGHEKYLTKLQNDKHVTLRALERLSRRAADVMYKKKQWFDWVKQCQDSEESQRETESRKVKLEALLFKRHQKEIDRRQHEMKALEDEKRQGEYLDEAYTQRLSDEEQNAWDPVQDASGQERENYVDLIKYFLMLKEKDVAEPAKDEGDTTSGAQKPISNAPETKLAEKALSKSAKKRAKKANAEAKKLAEPSSNNANGRGPDVIVMETKQQMRQRLRGPVKFEKEPGWYFAGNKDPHNADTYWSPLPEDEIEHLLQEVAEVKNFLFCRLLLGHASLLSPALKAASIDEFLSNPEVTQEHLRDVCLKLERPTLQDVRDSCADFIRGEHQEEDEEDADTADDAEFDEDDPREIKRKLWGLKVKDSHGIPEKYLTKREKAARKKRQAAGKNAFGEEDSQGLLDFGDSQNENGRGKSTKIRVCGRTMYNYPSEKSMNRGGWFHFAVIAKDSDLYDAVELCRNWDEFFELNILCLYHYFPAAKWTMFVGDVMRQQLIQLGFVPYFIGDKADKVTSYFQSGSRGMARQSHQVLEMRNFICGHIKRNDPVSRRFLQYLALETWELRCLVRDPRTGKVLTQPPEKDELWLIREKSGWGRASRNDFKNVSEVSPAFFEHMDEYRKWRFGFDDYYDVYIWDAVPGRPFTSLHGKLQQILARAIRVREIKDMFKQSEPVLKTIHKDFDSERIRTIKPGEQIKSVWDMVQGGSAYAYEGTPENFNHENNNEGLSDAYIYTEADELEDAFLFPEEATGHPQNNLFKEYASELDNFEHKPFIDMRRWANDMDTDEESDEDFDEDLDEDSDGDFDEDFEEDTDEDASSGEENYYDMSEGQNAASLQDHAADGNRHMKVEEEQEKPGRWHSGYVTREMQEEGDKAVEIFSEHFQSMAEFSKGGPDYFVPIVKNPSTARNIHAAIRDDPPELMAALRYALASQQEYGSTHDEMEGQFLRHIDREKSKVFKDSWHMADMEPGARQRYVQSIMMVIRMDDYIMSKLTSGPFELCAFMKMCDHFRDERRVVKDAFEAYAAIALFFETSEFLNSEQGQMFRDVKLFDQKERAKHVPDRRTHLSNKTMPRDFWREWDKRRQDNGRTPQSEVDDIYPMEWRKAIRAVVMRLFKAGIICTAYGGAPGVAMAKAEEGRELDLYVDFRCGFPDEKIFSRLKDPREFDRAYLLSRARNFLSEHGGARFAVLRLWSAPHFYPLMLGIENRRNMTFLDDRGRAWSFRFIPKDMPYSEWSIHQTLAQRIEPYRDMFGDKVVVAKDMVFVMGKNEMELRRLSEGATWATQTRPWRLEVDFWRSFVNVDLEFLEGLDERWLA